ncbi:hypothetical protein P7D22_04770 [Lichenihabitans sp. Uapishka_5]|uniref:hypothetical protein n=1 Tax=Lichenihabitans sp. Uapishka_5 TaxID=3037302 RepID=UPI0029E7FFF8|nr:hypothetical protein [Lichenihabitans sp. Uapishka_5]MDX7950492.1 hypothetical protein [Lichenihabitans sp. Uapishka_5]
MRPDLLLAYADLVEASQPSIAYCREYGIDFAATVPACGGVFLAEVEPHGRTFEPREGAAIAAWCEALAEDAETVLDVVAWPVEQPAHWWTLSGFAPALGMAHAINGATYSFGGALHLHRTPLAWLQAGCNGAVILDPSVGARWLLDLPAPRIAAEDDAHACEIMRARQALTERQTIVVPQGRRQPDREAA